VEGSVSDWNAKIIEEFRTNEGRVGGRFEGRGLLLLHTIGRKSGVERVNPLAYYPDDGRYVIIASKGGAPTNPDWYYNLLANPRVTAEVGTQTFEVDAVELAGEERDLVWKQIVEAMPGFGEYEKNTERIIPLVALTPVG
jgi:deazaflavin-dependent oxidoreductase (nitroreductase family)